MDSRDMMNTASNWPYGWPMGTFSPYDELDAIFIISGESIRIWLYILVHLSVFIRRFIL